MIRTGPGTSVQRTVSAPCVTPSEVIYIHVSHCYSGTAELLFNRKSVPAVDTVAPKIIRTLANSAIT